MEFKHTSVLFEACMEGLAIKPDGIYVDGTLGGGGHSSGICARLSAEGTLIKSRPPKDFPREVFCVCIRILKLKTFFLLIFFIFWYIIRKKKY